ncbi:hypothetical protein GCM10023192_29850 [Amycolatopsis samaneae]
MDAPDYIRTGDIQYLVTALETCEIIQTEVVGLQGGTHRTVGYQDPGAEGVE